MSSSALAKVSLATASLALILAVAASAATNSLTLKGPSSVKLGTKFSYSVSGHTASHADFVAAFEPPTAKPCASTYNRELSIGGTDVGNHVKTNRAFSFKLHLKANKKGKHVLCAYLIDSNHKHTYGRAGAQWLVQP